MVKNTAQLQRLHAILRSLNSSARIIDAEHGKVALNQILNTGLFNFDKAQQAPGWPVITKRKPPLPDADAWKDVTNKHATLKD